MVMMTQWHCPTHDPERVARLAAALNRHPAVAAILLNRGISDHDQAQAFLSPTLAQIKSPFSIKDMEKAVDRIVQAVRQGETICIFGDYDVDGMTSTSLLLDFFRHFDLTVLHHIPDRITEGYGLSPQAIEQQAVAKGVELIITTDCGITGHEAVRLANRHGIDVIITDHHEPSKDLPDALAVVNPKRLDCPSELAHLAGVGVAFYLALALRHRLREMGFWNAGNEPNLKHACDLVALGTVADMVPLLGENRVLVKAGLEILATRPRPGLRALLAISGAANRPVDTWDLAYRLAPRLNAAGRLGTADTGCALLTTACTKTAERISFELDEMNVLRKDIEQRILEDISRRLGQGPPTGRHTLVLKSPDWHEGVIGIVAARLVDQFMRPVALIALRDGIGKGSARSPEGVDLFGALSACSPYLEKFGGHKVAAGFSVKQENISDFHEAFENAVRDHIDPQAMKPGIRIDTRITPEMITPALLDDIEQIAPFGMANPEPVFALSELDAVSCHRVGKAHTKMRLRPKNGDRSRTLDAIIFNMDPAELPGRFRQVACNLRWNRWLGTKRAQVVIRDFKPE
ncbi:MAG: single-stranded-DNA-specific exonuclease RecJ [Deltaproteobacteria bacterium]|nr:single-stranded-DNA-specific exonuclease RecJ [Deltaproteobacteria bacterium]